MRKINTPLLLLSCLLGNLLIGQTWEKGDLAPNFTLNDIEGNEIELYSYLDDDKAAVLYCMTTWAGPAWHYYRSGELQTMQGQFADKLQVIAMELYPATEDTALYGVGNTMGNWMEHAVFPVINTGQELPVTAFPTMIIACPDKRIIMNQVGGLPGALEVVDEIDRLCGDPTADLEAPEIHGCPTEDFWVRNEDSAGYYQIPDLRSQITVTDNMDPNPVVTQTPEEWTLVYGAHQLVTLEATDSTGNKSICQFMYHFIDGEIDPPVADRWKVGELATNIDVPDLNGNNFRLYDELDKGKAVMVYNFSAWLRPSWSDFIGGELHKMMDLPGDPISVWGIDQDPMTTDTILTGSYFGDWTKRPLDLLSNPRQPILALDALPTMYLVCPNRRIVKGGMYYRPTAAEAFEDVKLCEKDSVASELGFESCPQNKIKAKLGDGESEVPVWWTPPAPVGDHIVSVVSTHSPGDKFPKGKTIVTYTVVNKYYEVATCSFIVHVRGKNKGIQILSTEDLLNSLSEVISLEEEYEGIVLRLLQEYEEVEEHDDEYLHLDILLANILGAPGLSEMGVTMYPNPVSGNLTVNHNSEVNQIRVMDIQGNILKVVPRQNDRNTIIDTTEFSKGMYVLQVVNEKGEVAGELFVVE